jgi:hypothetical protein
MLEQATQIREFMVKIRGWLEVTEMKTQKLIRPLMQVGEVFQIPIESDVGFRFLQNGIKAMTTVVKKEI